MAQCISSLAYTMEADIYIAMITQDDTGAAQKVWIFEKSVPCRARGILRKGVGENSTAFDINNYVNIMNDLVKMRTSDPIPSDRRVASVRNDDQVIYLENLDPATEGGLSSDGSTIFEPRGSTPIVNFNGSILEYETVLMRSEVQKLAV